MQIACPQCSMQYDLDPRLLPPSGTSVQCTRCSFVFTATSSGQVLIPNPSAGTPAPRGGEVSRTSTSNGTKIFGNPYATQAPPAGRGAPPPAHTTQVFGAVPLPEERTPVFGTALPELSAAPAPTPQTTQVFGAVPPAGPLPSTGKTQVFGAPPPRSPATTTQVFGAAPPPQKPSASTTLVFGAAPPAPPPATTTQVFGAVPLPAPSASTTQVFGAASVPPQAPSAATTQTFGAREVQAAAGTDAGKGAPPGLRQKKAGPEVPWNTTGEHDSPPVPLPELPGERPAPAVSRPIELPAEAVVMPRPPLPSLPPEPEVERASTASRRGAPLELPPEMMVPVPRSESRQPSRAPARDLREPLLFGLAALVVLGLTAWLTYPSWRNQAPELPPEAVTTKEEAVALLRRDDASSREQAIQRLRTLVERHPKFTEAQAELVVALSLWLDDTKVDLEWITQEEQRLRREISALELAKAPSDWSSRVNTRKDELEALRGQRQPLERTVAELTKQLEEALVVIRAAPEAEPAADVVARLKAQAVHGGVLGTPQAVGLAERLRQAEKPAHWSAIALAEYGLNAHSPPSALVDVSESLGEVRERDRTFLRAYVLGARLALRQQDPATAQTLLDTVVALNPNHTLARTLQKWATASAGESTAAPTP